MIYSPQEIVISIHLSIFRIYIAPLQGNYSEAFSAQARAKREVLRRLYKELENGLIQNPCGHSVGPIARFVYVLLQLII